MSTNFRLELIEPSAREVVGLQFCLALTLFRVSLGLSHVPFSSLHSPLALLSRPESKNKYLSSRRRCKLLTKISGHNFFRGMFNILRRIPRQHWPAISRSETGLPIGITVPRYRTRQICCPTVDDFFFLEHPVS